MSLVAEKKERIKFNLTYKYTIMAYNMLLSDPALSSVGSNRKRVVIPVERNESLSKVVPSGSLIGLNEVGAMDTFGSTVMRKPTGMELQFGVDPESWIVSTIYDYRPVIPTDPPIGEAQLGLTADVPSYGAPIDKESDVAKPGTALEAVMTTIAAVPLSGDLSSFVDKTVMATKDLVVGAWNKGKEVYTDMSPESKKALLAAGAVAAAFPLLKVAFKSAPFALLAARRRGDGSIKEAGAISEAGDGTTIDHIRAGMDPSQYAGDVSQGDVIAVPVGFWRACIALGDKFDNRELLAPWEDELGVLGGDPMILRGCFVPEIYFSKEGDMIRSSAPYSAAVLSGGLWDKIKSSVGKVVKGVVNSPILSSVASFIPGGSAIAAAAKSVVNKLVPDEASPGDSSPSTASVSESVTAPKVPVSEPIVSKEAQMTPSPGAFAKSGSTMTAKAGWTEVAEGVASPEMLPDAWQAPVAQMGLPEDQEARIKEVIDNYELPIAGSPAVLAAALPFLKQAAIFAAFTAAPYVIKKTTQFFKKTPAAATTAVNSGKRQVGGFVVTTTADAPKSGFIQSLKSFANKLPGRLKVLKSFGVLGAFLAAAGLAVHLWWSGRSDRLALGRAIGNVLPDDLKDEWKQYLTKTSKSHVPNLTPEQAQEFTALIMVAYAIALEREQQGIATDDDKMVLKDGRDLVALMQEANPQDSEAAIKIAEGMLKELDDVDLPDSRAEIGKPVSAAEIARSMGVGTAMDRQILAEGSGSAAGVEASDAQVTSDMTVEAIQQAIDSDPDLEVKIMEALKTSDDGEQFAKKLALFGVPAALVTGLIALWNSHRAAEGKTSVLSSQFWNDMWNETRNRIQLIPLRTRLDKVVDSLRRSREEITN